MADVRELLEERFGPLREIAAERHRRPLPRERQQSPQQPR